MARHGQSRRLSKSNKWDDKFSRGISMQVKKTNPANNYIWIGALACVALTAVIGLTAANLTRFPIVGHTGIAFYYPWQLREPNSIARLTAWSGYLLHNIFVWIIIYLAQREKPKFENK